MKKIGILISLLFICSLAFATTYNTVSWDGVIDEWDADEEMGTEVYDSKNFTFWLTWDDTNIYLGLERETADWFLGDNAGNLSLFVAFDTDQTLNSGGTTDGYARVNFGNDNYLPEEIYYYAGGAGWYESSSWNSGTSIWDWNGWTDANTFYGYDATHLDDEMAISFADLGSPTSLGVYAWLTEEGGTDILASWPLENPIGTSPTFNYLYLFDNLGSGVSPNDPTHTLPVELSAFTATFVDNHALIQWTTATETNVQGFNIYRNTELDFNSAQKINANLISAQGTTTEPQDYQFTDINPVCVGTSYYYWLESVDFSSTTEVYNAIKFEPEEGQGGFDNTFTENKLNCYPNPAKNNIQIDYAIKGRPTSSSVKVTVYNILGNVVKTKEINSSQNNLDISELNSGVYFYQVKEAGFNQIKKMVVID